MTNEQAGPKVSDEDLIRFDEIGYGWRHGDAPHKGTTLLDRIEDLVADIRASRQERDDSRASEARLRQELAAKDAEIERLKDQTFELKGSLASKMKEIERWREAGNKAMMEAIENGTRAERAEAALRAARTVDDEMVERVTAAFFKAQTGYELLPIGRNENDDKRRSDMRAALTAALSPGQAGGKIELGLIGRAASAVWFGVYPGEDTKGGDATSHGSPRETNETNKKTSNPPPQSHDQACGGDESDVTLRAHVLLRCACGQRCWAEEQEVNAGTGTALECPKCKQGIGEPHIVWRSAVFNVLTPFEENFPNLVNEIDAAWEDAKARFEDEPLNPEEAFKAGFFAARRASQPNAAVAAVEQPNGPSDPVLSDLEDPAFQAIWSVIKSWDVNAPWYGGYCGATGNHVMAIIAALRSLPSAPEPAQPTASDLVRRLDHVLHGMCNEGSDDDRWHAERAHGLVREAARHLSPDANVRELARAECESAQEPVAQEGPLIAILKSTIEQIYAVARSEFDGIVAASPEQQR